jgi:hypothetical protein
MSKVFPAGVSASKMISRRRSRRGDEDVCILLFEFYSHFSPDDDPTQLIGSGFGEVVGNNGEPVSIVNGERRSIWRF